jgi:hypothetical protein
MLQRVKNIGHWTVLVSISAPRYKHLPFQPSLFMQSDEEHVDDMWSSNEDSGLRELVQSSSG